MISKKSLQTVFARILEKAQEASAHDDSASAAAFFWSASELERVYPFLAKAPRREVKTWNIVERSTGKVFYQKVAACAPEVGDDYIVREAVARSRRPDDYSDRSQMRAESGYAQ